MPDPHRDDERLGTEIMALETIVGRQRDVEREVEIALRECGQQVAAAEGYARQRHMRRLAAHAGHERGEARHLPGKPHADPEIARRGGRVE